MSVERTLGVRSPVELVGDAESLLVEEVAQNNFRPLLDEEACLRRAQAARSSGDKRDLSF